MDIASIVARAEAQRRKWEVYTRLQDIVGQRFHVARSYGHAAYEIVGMGERDGRDVSYSLFHFRPDGEAVIDGNIVVDPDRTFKIHFRRLGGYDGPPRAPSITQLLRWAEVPTALTIEALSPTGAEEV